MLRQARCRAVAVSLERQPASPPRQNCHFGVAIVTNGQASTIACVPNHGDRCAISVVVCPALCSPSLCIRNRMRQRTTLRWLAGLSLAFTLCKGALGQDAKEATAGDAQKLVTLRRIFVEGTRLPTLSVVRLAEIKVGDQVNFLKLHEALQKVTKSGLISNIDFEYESLPDKETEVVLHMKCTDVAPTAKATIAIPQVDENEVWAWLGQVDPLFTRDMPPTEAAIKFYSYWIGKYMEAHGVPDFQKGFAIVADASRSKGGHDTDRLLFKVAKRRVLK